jgi:glyoxylase-like metal-dependent hydrolase (beta-lactamase superfamily II)
VTAAALAHGTRGGEQLGEWSVEHVVKAYGSGPACLDWGMVGPAPGPRGWTVDPARAEASEELSGVWRLKLPLAWPEVPHVNVWALALEGGGVALVDCGMAGAGAWEGLQRALRAAGGSVRDVRIVAVTHAHADHVGLAARVRAESGCEVWMHPRADGFLAILDDFAGTERARARRSRREGVPEALIADYACMVEEADGTLSPIEVDAPLVPGVHVPSALGDWDVVETPGHTPSHVCLYQPERRLLIAGDLVARQFVPYFDYGWSEDPVAEYLASLDAVAALEVDLVLPGHGRPLREFGSLVASHRAGVLDRLAAVRSALAAGPASGYDLTKRIFGRPPSVTAGVWQLVEVLCYLGHLRRAGEVERSEDAGGVYAYALA